MRKEPVGELWKAKFERDKEAYKSRGVNKRFFTAFIKGRCIQLIKEYVPLQGGERVLEPGCGSGRFSVSLAVIGCHVTALDYSEECLKSTQELRRTAEAYFGQLSLQTKKGDITHLDIPDNVYDLVVNEGVIEHWLGEAERIKVLKEMVRVAKPKGVVAVFVPNGKHPLHHWWVRTNYPGYTTSPPMTLYDKSKLRQEMQRAGLKDLRTDGISAFHSLNQWPRLEILKYPLGFANRYFPLPKGVRERWGAHLVCLGRKKGV